MNIYNNLNSAIQYYASKGYKNIDVPWEVSKEIISITLPPHIDPPVGINRFLVGSAEQSFLQLVFDRNLKGKYQATTPCFRREDNITRYTKNHFMKTELFINDFKDQKETLSEVINDAYSFYSQLVPVKIIETDEGFDIVTRKGELELGSYGFRTHSLIGSWIYGTGCAEPRLSLAMEDFK